MFAACKDAAAPSAAEVLKYMNPATRRTTQSILFSAISAGWWIFFMDPDRKALIFCVFVVAGVGIQAIIQDLLIPLVEYVKRKSFR